MPFVGEAHSIPALLGPVAANRAEGKRPPPEDTQRAPPCARPAAEPQSQPCTGRRGAARGARQRCPPGPGPTAWVQAATQVFGFFCQWGPFVSAALPLWSCAWSILVTKAAA